jgi:hypothetical protein
VDYTHIILVIISLAASGFVGLIGWGLRKQVEVLDRKVETVRREFHARLAEAVNEFYRQVKGNCLRREMFAEFTARVD